jgi:hypothetical protein
VCGVGCAATVSPAALPPAAHTPHAPALPPVMRQRSGCGAAMARGWGVGVASGGRVLQGGLLLCVRTGGTLCGGGYGWSSWVQVLQTATGVPSRVMTAVAQGQTLGCVPPATATSTPHHPPHRTSTHSLGGKSLQPRCCSTTATIKLQPIPRWPHHVTSHAPHQVKCAILPANTPVNVHSARTRTTRRCSGQTRAMQRPVARQCAGPWQSPVLLVLLCGLAATAGEHGSWSEMLRGGAT